MELTALNTAAQQVAASRSRFYQLLACAFAFPDEDLFAQIADATLATRLAEVCAELPHDLGEVLTAELAAVGDSYVEFESEYIRLFDVGAAGPPCPLHGGVYIGDRMKVMEDATRFYNFFGLRLAADMPELPDHITTELEFMHFLTFREAQAGQQGLDVTPLLRAERDFLTRHLCKWVPHLQAKLAKQGAAPFFLALVRLALAFFEQDRRYAAAAC